LSEAELGERLAPASLASRLTADASSRRAWAAERALAAHFPGDALQLCRSPRRTQLRLSTCPYRPVIATLDRVGKVTYRNIFESQQIRCFLVTKKNSGGGSLISKQKIFAQGGITMLTITVLTAAAGLALGLRFNVFVVALLVILAIIGTVAFGVLGGSSLLVVALHLLAMLACLQIGYLIGSLISAQLPARVISLTETRYVRRLSARS
jgi:hypothetical protein